MTNRRKKFTDDLRTRTNAVLTGLDGWSHQFALHLIRTLGYEAVSSAVDEALDPALPIEAQRERLKSASEALNEQARGKPKEQDA